MMDAVDAVGKLADGYWNSDPVGPGNPGGMDEAVDGSEAGHERNFPAALKAVGVAAQFTGQQAQLAGQDRSAVADMRQEVTTKHGDVVNLAQQMAADAVSTALRIVETIADLRALTATMSAARPTAQVRGYHSAGDGGGGLFRWDGTSSAADNGGTVVALTAGGGGRWRRVYDGSLNVRWFGAKGGDITADTAAFQAAHAALPAEGGVIHLPAGTYAIGALAVTKPVMWVSDAAKINGVMVARITNGAFLPIGGNLLTIRSDSNTDTGIGTTIQVQRFSRTNEGFLNPKALRVVTQVDDPVSMTEYAVSGELISYTNAVGSLGNTAVSGTAFKHGLVGVFAGHFQANDYNVFAAPTDVTPIVGVETNVTAVGLDHPTANGNVGQRIVHDVIAITNPNVAGAATAEIGCGVRIRTSSGSGYFRYGLVIDEMTTNPSHIGTGALIRTGGDYGLRVSGANTVGIEVDGAAAYGMRLMGGFTTGTALLIGTDKYIGLESTNVVRLRYDSSKFVVALMNGATERVGLNVSSGSPGLTVLGNKVMGARKGGWGVPTGTADRTTFDTATVTLQQLAARFKALVEDLHSSTSGHGAIGP